MKRHLDAYRLGGEPMEIRPAGHARLWMDATNRQYAYRCMPLVSANTYGWELLCPDFVTILWNGDSELNSIRIDPPRQWCCSHFGYGIFTFQIPYLFRTSPDADLLVSGPVNHVRITCMPLEGIVETSWSPMTFTMNWMVTIMNKLVTFSPGEPICRIVPIARDFVTTFEPKIHEHEDIPTEISEEHRAWNNRRAEFLRALQTGDPDTVQAGWQKEYYKRSNGKFKLPKFTNPKHHAT